jgi:trehalose synthase
LDTLPPCTIITPSIDPLSPKNVPLDNQTITRTLRRYRIDPDRPLITQVSRYDPWKDPLGVIDAYRMVKKEVPEVMLLLAASMATDDPESWHYYEKTARHAGEDDDIFLLSNLQGVGNMEINAFQRGSEIVVQKSLQEGFGLTVTEAMWKEKPVIGGRVGGITLQIDDGVNGFLVNSVESCAERLITCLRNKEEARHIAAAGRDKVRERFLSTTNLKAYLDLFRGLEVAEEQHERKKTFEQRH